MMTMSRRFFVVFCLFLSISRLPAQIREDSSISLTLSASELRYTSKNLSHIISKIVSASPKDTVQLTIDSLEHLFLKNNLALISQKFDIEASKAEVIQAKLFENPTFYY